MGTRNLVAVQIDGQYKIAQYGQWDGYPEGKGVEVLGFLRERMNEEVFTKALRNSSFIAPEKLEDLWRQYGADENGWVTLEQSEAMKRDHPEFSRDTGAKILDIVQGCPDGVELNDSISFAGDGLSCEWIWVIDFDKRTFEGYEGGGDKRLESGERFAEFDSEEGVMGYHSPHLVASFPLDDLPDEETFLSNFKAEEEEQDE